MAVFLYGRLQDLPKRSFHYGMDSIGLRSGRVWTQDLGQRLWLYMQGSPADTRVTRDSAVIPRWPSAAILDFIEPQLAPFDPRTPKTLA